MVWVSSKLTPTTPTHPSSRPRLLPIKEELDALLVFEWLGVAAEMEFVVFGRSRIPFFVIANATVAVVGEIKDRFWLVGRTGDLRSVAERCAEALTG